MRYFLFIVLVVTLTTATSAQTPPKPAPAAKAWFDRAMVDLQNVTRREDKAELQARAAGTAADLGDAKLAEQLQQAALANVTFTDDLTIGATMSALAVSHARAGRVDAAIGSAKLAGAPVDIAAAAADAALVRFQRGDRTGFDQIMALAQEQRAAVGDPFDQAFANQVVADALAQAGDFAAAVALGSAITDAAARAEALASLAARAAAAGKTDQARQLLTAARAAIAAHIQESKDAGQEPYLDFINAAIVDALSALGQSNQALELIPTMEDSMARAWAWIEVASDTAAAGAAAAAQACYAKAGAAILEMPDPYDRGLDLMRLAQSRSKAGLLDDPFTQWITARATPVERALAALGITDALLEAKTGQ
jgi:hypothetical protein